MWEEADSLADALKKWKLVACRAGFGSIVDSWTRLPSTPAMVASSSVLADIGARQVSAEESFEVYLELAATMDAAKQRRWSVEADMQLVDFMSRCADRYQMFLIYMLLFRRSIIQRCNYYCRHCSSVSLRWAVQGGSHFSEPYCGGI